MIFNVSGLLLPVIFDFRLKCIANLKNHANVFFSIDGLFIFGISLDTLLENMQKIGETRKRGSSITYFFAIELFMIFDFLQRIIKKFRNKDSNRSFFVFCGLYDKLLTRFRFWLGGEDACFYFIKIVHKFLHCE